MVLQDFTASRRTIPDDLTMNFMIADFGDYSFPALDHTIGFAFSAALQMEMMQRVKAPEPPDNALVMAPFFTEDPSLLGKTPYPTSIRKTVDPLPYSGRESYTALKSLGLGQAQHEFFDPFQRCWIINEEHIFNARSRSLAGSSRALKRSSSDILALI